MRTLREWLDANPVMTVSCIDGIGIYSTDSELWRLSDCYVTSSTGNLTWIGWHTS
jgi:hypothetical protein